MNPLQQPNRASSDAWALPHSRGKASQWPAFTPVPLSKIGLIRHPTANLGATKSLSHLWQGGIGSGPYDCNALPATSLESGMTLWHWVLLAFGLYALCGVGVATMFMQTPYADNGWLIIFLLWPLFLFGG